jgi:hypothetical protein
MDEEQASGVGLSFIDILFAIVVGIGFEQAIERPWFRDLISNWSSRDLWLFVFANAVVIASWIGYHRMMTEEKLDPAVRGWQGFVRFPVDILLLFFYCRLVVRLDYPGEVFTTTAWVFGLYLIWDLVVITERRVEKRSGVSAVWFAAFLALSYGSQEVVKLKGEWYWYPCCVLGLFGVFLYRWQARFRVPILDAISAVPTSWFEWMFGRFRRVNPMRIYVAGPYTAEGEEEIARNVNRAIDASLELYKKGHWPYVPHLTHLIDKRAKELGVSITREDYVQRWDKPWLVICDALLYLGDSPGAKEELEAARCLGKEVFLMAENVKQVASRVA